MLSQLFRKTWASLADNTAVALQQAYALPATATATTAVVLLGTLPHHALGWAA